MNHSRYADLFRTESREHLAEIDAALLALEQRANDPVAIASQVASLFRSTHTIKGMAGAMGYVAVERLSHALETVLDAVRRNTRALDADALELLFDGSDALRHTLDATDVDGGGTITRAVQALLDRLDALSDTMSDDAHPPNAQHVAPAASSVANANSAIRGDIFCDARMTDARQVDARAANAAAATPDAPPDRVVEIRLTADCQLKGVRALIVLARLQTLGTVRSMTPAQPLWQLEEFDGILGIVLQSTHTDTDIETAVRGAGDVARVSVRAVEPLVPSKASGAVARTIRMDLSRLDTLLDLVGELVITRDRLLRATDAAVEGGADRMLTRVAHETARLVSALQEEVLQVRMVPVGQVFDRFPRQVRDIARELGKDVQFTCEGRDVELDRSLLDAIGEPIVHLLRNALDHGIEDAAAREQAGKPSTGQLVLRAGRDRSSVVIQVEDDGRGIDRDAIRTRAQLQGIIDAKAGALTDDELLHILAHPGFSTASTVTSISGRGVGVDVVMTRVRALGGTLELETAHGEGSAFTIRLPVTLAIIRALLVRVDAAAYAIPAAHVIEVLEYRPGTIVTSVAGARLPWRDELLPIVRLRERFGLPFSGDETFVAVVESAGRRSALFVDALLSQHDIVVKPLDIARGSLPLFNGATVLGDGTPSLIVDVGSLC